MGFIRYEGGFLSRHTGRPMGIFGVAHKLKEARGLTSDQEQAHAAIVRWCEDNLPNPPFYALGNPEGYVTWFKESANEAVSLMEDLQAIIADAGGRCEKVLAERPEVVVYEDEYQIAVKPEH